MIRAAPAGEAGRAVLEEPGEGDVFGVPYTILREPLSPVFALRTVRNHFHSSEIPSRMPSGPDDRRRLGVTGVEQYVRWEFTMSTMPTDVPRKLAAQRQLASGNRMVALGAIAAGCRFFSGYPITPASEIYQTMIEELSRPESSGLALAAPDEISALAYCVGASMAGHKAMTATSGPGWCLMIETLQYALMTETPVVIAVVQRLGPSTGGATQGAQGDVLLTQFCTSGGYTIPVFAPSNTRECYELTLAAFAWSELLRTPVVLLSDKEVGMTLESVDVSSLPRAIAPRRPFYREKVRFQSYDCPAPGEAPPFAPVGGEARVVATGSAHDRHGKLKKNSAEVIELLAHLQIKITAHAEEMAMTRADFQAGAQTLLLCYGITARAAWEATLRLRAAGHKVSFLQLKTLFPIPATTIRQAARNCTRVILAEENLMGLYASVVEPLLDGSSLIRVNAVGSMIPPARMIEAVEGGL